MGCDVTPLRRGPRVQPGGHGLLLSVVRAGRRAAGAQARGRARVQRDRHGQAEAAGVGQRSGPAVPVRRETAAGRRRRPVDDRQPRVVRGTAGPGGAAAARAVGARPASGAAAGPPAAARPGGQLPRGGRRDRAPAGHARYTQRGRVRVLRQASAAAGRPLDRAGLRAPVVGRVAERAGAGGAQLFPRARLDENRGRTGARERPRGLRTVDGPVPRRSGRTERQRWCSADERRRFRPRTMRFRTGTDGRLRSRRRFDGNCS